MGAKYLYAKVPGLHYVVDACYSALTLAVITIPALVFVGTLAFGLGGAVLSSIVSVPMYFILLVTSGELLMTSIILVSLILMVDVTSDIYVWLSDKISKRHEAKVLQMAA